MHRRLLARGQFHVGSVRLHSAIWQRLHGPTQPPRLKNFLPVLGKNPHPLTWYLTDWKVFVKFNLFYLFTRQNTKTRDL